MRLFAVIALLVACLAVTSLRCHQCNGWLGNYPPRFTQASTCDNRNNHCETNLYCVRILDAMAPGVEYVTYKSDCFYQTTLQVNPTNLSYVQGRTCFPFQDGSAPVKRWFYCFCNDRDYCNSSRHATFLILPVLLLVNFCI